MASSSRRQVLTEVLATVDPSRREALVAGFESLLAASLRMGCYAPSSSTSTMNGGFRPSGETVKRCWLRAPARLSPWRARKSS